jgi:ABC-type molybdate transport system substrate-binding protein
MYELGVVYRKIGRAEADVATALGALGTANHPAPAKAFLSFLASAEADAAMRRHGMEPARTVV